MLVFFNTHRKKKIIIIIIIIIIKLRGKGRKDGKQEPKYIYIYIRFYK